MAPIPPEDAPRVLAVAEVLARLHAAPYFTFWTAEDWGKTYGVHLTRLDSEHVRIQAADLGKGTLAPPA